jgi:hypothetical protein
MWFVKAKQFKSTLIKLQEECERKKKAALQEEIALLPKVQQDMIMCLLQCAKRKGPTGNRYNNKFLKKKKKKTCTIVIKRKACQKKKIH